MQTPDNVIGETLVVQGRVEFKNLLRIDGHFEVMADENIEHIDPDRTRKSEYGTFYIQNEI